MKQVICAVYDSAAAQYEDPFVARTTGEALRAFDEICTAPNSRVNRYADDYSLFRIGSYETDDGMIIPETPVRLVGAHEVIATTSREVATDGA